MPRWLLSVNVQDPMRSPKDDHLLVALGEFLNALSNALDLIEVQRSSQTKLSVSYSLELRCLEEQASVVSLSYNENWTR
jgi:hypothetical protein